MSLSKGALQRWPPQSGQSRRGEGGTQDPALQFFPSPQEGQKERGVQWAAHSGVWLEKLQGSSG